MFMRKFEADTLEEALKDIKKELGPDAIILKTVTNKGLKGAFKKKKIEITAAISEKNLVKKTNVDKILPEDAKTKFYSSDSGHIGKMINQYSENNTNANSNTTPQKSGYGNIALNKAPISVKENSVNLNRGLDEFLNHDVEEDELSIEGFSFSKNAPVAKASQRAEAKPREAKASPQIRNNEQKNTNTPANNEQARELYISALDKIAELERKIFDLSKNLETKEKTENRSLYELRNTLRSLDIDNTYINKLLMKVQYELNQTQIENSDLVFEAALKDMMTVIKTDSANFSKEDASSSNIIVLISEASNGQTTSVKKLATLKNEAVVINYNENPNSEAQTEKEFSFTNKVFNINNVRAGSISEIISVCRKCTESEQDVIIDFRIKPEKAFEAKQLLDGLKRSFDKVECIVTLSAIHSEVYNRKILSTYQNLLDGILITHLDLCLSYGAIFNLAYTFNKIPIKFFSTGSVIPDDLEAATSERILAGIFNL